MSEVDFSALHRKMGRLFTYRSDQSKHGRFEHWASHADAVRNDEPFTGDCDDYALTIAELLVERGADPAKVAIVFCRTENDEPHLACLYKGWILDNRNGWPVDWSRIGYDYLRIMRMSAPGEWRAFEAEE